uniref:hypothetical protein n=1 Tax=Arthrobacter sp. TaxID=1667 RepID=UPI000EB61C55|nr:hypothetical protein [Arthrobacter sp.]AXV46447.1 hypothetical protein pA44BH1_p03 [Arthrobacter sp.]AXV46483.1 hypothetical protein pA48BH1_p03 [Arthrobacter sp.]
MKIERARLQDTPALAWIAAQAFAAESAQAGNRRSPQALYLMHLYSLGLLACSGRLWHWDKRAIIAIEYKKSPSLWRWIALAGLCSVAAVALVVWISTADRDGLQALLVIMKAGGAVGVGILLLLLPAVVPALGEMHPRRSARNADAIRQWRKTLPGRAAYKVSYLAMYPQTREGLAFARAAIDRAVPAGEPLYTEARSESHKTIYARRGLHPLAAADGTTTLAMGTR